MYVILLKENLSKPFNKIKTALGMDDVLPWGRYQGYTVEEILKDRPEYIAWLISDTSLRFYPSVHQEIQRRALEIVNAYRPRRRAYYYGGDLVGEEANYSIQDQWDDVPF